MWVKGQLGAIVNLDKMSIVCREQRRDANDWEVQAINDIKYATRIVLGIYHTERKARAVVNDIANAIIGGVKLFYMPQESEEAGDYDDG